MKRVLGAVADLHIFSRYGLNPPEFITNDNLFKFSIHSDALKYIYETFVWYAGVLDEWGADTIIVDGDVVHGQNPKERGSMLVSPQPLEQVKAAVGLLSLLKYGVRGNFNRKMYFWEGSGYHVNVNGVPVEQLICNELQGRWMGFKTRMKFPPSEKVFQIEHGGGMSYQYPETKLGKTLLYLNNQQAVFQRDRVSCSITAHHHDYIYLHKHRVQMVQLPGFIAAEPSPIYKGQIEKANCIGGVVITIDQDDRIRPIGFTKDPPEIIEKVVMG